MNTMNTPGFTAERSLQPVRGRYRSGGTVAVGSDAVIPSIPRCKNCDTLLDYCATHGGRPRAACIACATGNCDSGEERCEIDPITNRLRCF
jgi:hypothetical protein